MQSQTTKEIQVSIANSLYKNYLFQDYSFHLERNSSLLIRNIYNEVGSYISNALFPMFILLGEIFVVFGLIILLLTVEPKGAVAVATIFLIVGGAVYLLIKNRLLVWGEDKLFHDGKRMVRLTEGFNGVKEVKFRNIEEEFSEMFYFHENESAKNQMYINFIQPIPRLLMELVAVLSMVSLVFIMTSNGEKLEEVIPIFAVFVAAAYRIMPSANRILVSLQSIKYSKATVENLGKEYSISRVDRKLSVNNFYDSLKIKDLCFSYGEKEVLRDLNLTINKSESIGIIGESGAGKSTLIDVFLGLLMPNSGSIYVDTKEYVGSKKQFKIKIGYVPQSIYLADDTIKNNIAFGVIESKIDNEKIKQSIDGAMLSDYVSNLPNGANTMVGESGARLSGGQKQRLGIARALYSDIQILILDEATSSLDNKTEKDIIDTIRNLPSNITKIIISHRKSILIDCDKVFELRNMELVQIRKY